MDLNLKDKSVIVTGGGSNIGRAIALGFAREGAHLTIAEIDEGQGGKAAADARAQGAASAEVVPTDVTKWDSVLAMVRAAGFGEAAVVGRMVEGAPGVRVS